MLTVILVALALFIFCIPVFLLDEYRDRAKVEAQIAEDKRKGYPQC